MDSFHFSSFHNSIHGLWQKCQTSYRLLWAISSPFLEDDEIVQRPPWMLYEKMEAGIGTWVVSHPVLHVIYNTLCLIYFLHWIKSPALLVYCTLYSCFYVEKSKNAQAVLQYKCQGKTIIALLWVSIKKKLRQIFKIFSFCSKHLIISLIILAGGSRNRSKQTKN